MPSSSQCRHERLGLRHQPSAARPGHLTYSLYSASTLATSRATVRFFELSRIWPSTPTSLFPCPGSHARAQQDTRALHVMPRKRGCGRGWPLFSDPLLHFCTASAPRFCRNLTRRATLHCDAIPLALVHCCRSWSPGEMACTHSPLRNSLTGPRAL